MSENKLSTLLEILNYSSNFLKEHGIDEPRLNAELMLADVLNCRRIDLYIDFEKPLTTEEKSQLKIFLKRRIKREPLQYILGKTNFFGYEIMINESVLIPRQDTEILVEEVLNDIVEKGKNDVKIIEIGIGSGCIAVALLSELMKKNICYNYTGTDKSKGALEVARKNTEYHGLKNVNLVESDFLRDDLKWVIETEYIISNPPYVSYDEFNMLEPEVNKFEPMDAVTDMNDGFRFYEIFLKYYKDNPVNCFLEIAYNGKDRIEKMVKDYGIDNYSFVKDYNNNYRVLKLHK